MCKSFCFGRNLLSSESSRGGWSLERLTSIVEIQKHGLAG